VGQELHLQTVTEVLQSIKASEMTPMLQRIFNSEGGGETLDVLMKYLFVYPFFCDSILVLRPSWPPLSALHVSSPVASDDSS
jgi:hypothetical protein